MLYYLALVHYLDIIYSAAERKLSVNKFSRIYIAQLVNEIYFINRLIKIKIGIH